MKKLQQMAAEYGIPLTEDHLGAFQIYLDFLLEYNENVNLTAITQRDEVLEKHFLDSLLPLIAYAIPAGATLIDVGTGAGFPGVPLKIVRPDLHLTLLDSTQKRLTFLQLLETKLGQQSKYLHARAEAAAGESPHREGYQLAISRAVADLPVLLEYCLPYVSVGGVFLALKGPGGQEERDRAKQALSILGGEIESVKNYTLPSGDGRTILVVRKAKPSPSKYPRQGVKIRKMPI